MRRRRLVLTVAVGALLALPAPADAQVQRHCKSVTAGNWKATNVSAFNMGCKSVRAKLRRWLPRDRLPDNREGWYCGRASAIRGTNRQRSNFELTPQSGAVGFVFLRRTR